MTTNHTPQDELRNQLGWLIRSVQDGGMPELHVDKIVEWHEAEATRQRIDEQNEVIEGLFEQVGDGNVMEYDLVQIHERSKERIAELERQALNKKEVSR